MMNGFYYIIGIALILIFVWLLMLTIDIVYGQNTSPLIEHKYGAQTDDLHICAKYDPTKNCDIVPQNVPIPVDKIPYEGNKPSVTAKRIYT